MRIIGGATYFNWHYSMQCVAPVRFENYYHCTFAFRGSCSASDRTYVIAYDVHVLYPWNCLLDSEAWAKL